MASRSSTNSRVGSWRTQKRAKDRARAKMLARQEAEVKRVQGLTVQNPHAAGIDIGSRSHWVCVGNEADCVREFPAHTTGLQEIVAYLGQHQVTTVAMESTGIYWVALYQLLEAKGIEAVLVDARYTKQVKGRPKTDRRDCQWIYRLHHVGLLPGAFRPDARTCRLRAYLRQRANLIRYGSQHVQHMEKALEEMNLKLREVISDITGITGRAIIQAILKGTRDPLKLAELRNSHCQCSVEQIAEALHGSYQEEHVFALRQGYEAWQFYQKQISKLDEQIERQLAIMKQDRSLPPIPPPARRKERGGPNEPHFDVRAALYYVVGIDLTQIEGIGVMTALTVISEIGMEVSKFPTVKHFCSWLGLCPQIKKTGGRIRSSRTRPGVNRAALALRLAAFGLHSSKGALGAFLRRMKSRLGAPKAVTATAHKLARIVYLSLKHGKTYLRETAEEYAKKRYEHDLEVLKRKARLLGLEVVEKTPKPAPEAQSAQPAQ